jgi:nucleotide-binding universal stress UspA family protein
MKTILSLTDFSETADNAMKYAASLSESLASRLILVHVYETPVMYAEQSFATLLMADEQVQEASEKKLSGLKSGLQKIHPGLEIDYKFIEGGTPDQLVAIADDEKSDLIVMGTTAATKLERFLTGNTTEGMMQKAHCPVLCVPPDSKFNGIRRMVYSTDLHDDNLHAASSIASFAKYFDAEILFLYVDDRHIIHSDEKIEEMIAAIRTQIKYPKISGYISRDPHVDEGINYFLKKYPADLLVMFTHPKHFPASLFHRNLANTMSHQTTVPFLSIRSSTAPVLG